MTMGHGSGYEPVSITQLPLDSNGNLTTNLYVYLPTPKKFILFVPAGERFTPTRKSALERHTVPALFIEIEVTADLEMAVGPPSTGGSMLDYEVMGASGGRTLAQIFRGLQDASGVGAEESIKALEKVADEIVAIVAPDVVDLKSRILENAQHVGVMNDASAVTSIAVLFAVANGFDSQKSLREVVYAALVMDLPLIALGEEVTEQYYKNPELLGRETIEKLHQHPVEAYKLAKQSLRYFTETSMLLILNHHEYKNGMGWPRNVRTETLFPLAKVFAAAVDTFELLKRNQIRGENRTLGEIIQSLHENDIDAHLRRHNREVIDKILAFMGLAAADAGEKQAA